VCGRKLHNAQLGERSSRLLIRRTLNDKKTTDAHPTGTSRQIVRRVDKTTDKRTAQVSEQTARTIDSTANGQTAVIYRHRDPPGPINSCRYLSFIVADRGPRTMEAAGRCLRDGRAGGDDGRTDPAVHGPASQPALLVVSTYLHHHYTI